MALRFADHERFVRFVKIESGARTYLEIGVAAGRTLVMPETPVTLAVGVDPAFALVTPIERPASIALFRKSSDAFFAEADYMRLTRRPVDLTFVDGLHWCEFALRDVLNAERLSRRGSTILIHDIVPANAVEASRERTTDTWMGDIFRTVLALRHFRPDLTLTCLGDIPPSGMAIVTGLNPRAPSIDLAEAEHFMRAIDFERDFERMLRPLLVGSRSRAFERARQYFVDARTARTRSR